MDNINTDCLVRILSFTSLQDKKDLCGVNIAWNTTVYTILLNQGNYYCLQNLPERAALMLFNNFSVSQAKKTKINLCMLKEKILYIISDNKEKFDKLSECERTNQISAQKEIESIYKSILEDINLRDITNKRIDVTLYDFQRIEMFDSDIESNRKKIIQKALEIEKIKAEKENLSKLANEKISTIYLLDKQLKILNQLLEKASRKAD